MAGPSRGSDDLVTLVGDVKMVSAIISTFGLNTLTL